MEIKLFGSKSCMPCKMINTLLTNKKVNYTYVDAASSDEAADLGVSALPTILVDGVMHEGFDAAKKFVNTLK